MKKYYIKKFCWFIYAGYTEQIWDELHWDYKIVSDKEKWEEVLKEFGWDGKEFYITKL